MVAVDATAITMVITLTGTKFDSDGGCSPFITGPTAGTPGSVTLTCAAEGRSTINKMTIEVVELTTRAAILRLRPAG